MIRNEVFSCFVFYGVLLVLKMYIIAIITGQVRLRKKVSGCIREQRSAEICSCGVVISAAGNFLSYKVSFFFSLDRLLPTPRTR